jgi:hypothetical protein
VWRSPNILPYSLLFVRIFLLDVKYPENDFLLLNTIINPYYHSCVFMTDIYLTISLSTHIGDDTPQNDSRGFLGNSLTFAVILERGNTVRQ